MPDTVSDSYRAYYSYVHPLLKVWSDSKIPIFQEDPVPSNVADTTFTTGPVAARWKQAANDYDAAATMECDDALDTVPGTSTANKVENATSPLASMGILKPRARPRQSFFKPPSASTSTISKKQEGL